MMKKQRFCKSTVSLLLVFMMLVSMLTVGIVNTSAAETDVAETGDGTTRIFFQNNWQWSKVYIYVAGSSSQTASWPGYEMTYYADEGDYGVYYHDLANDADYVIFSRGDDGDQSINFYPEGGWTSAVCYYMKYENNQKLVKSFPYASTYALKGNFDNWKLHNFSNGSVSLQLTPGTYEFGIIGIGGNDNDNYYGNTGTITASIANWNFEKDKGNCKIVVSTAGTYTFNLNVTATQKLVSVTYPSSSGGGESGGDSGDGDDSGDGGTYYFAVAGYMTPTKITVKDANGNTISTIETFGTPIESAHDFTVNNYKEPCKVYAIKLDASAKKVVFTANNGDKSYSSAEYTLDSTKAIVVFEKGGVSQNDQLPYTAPGGSGGNEGGGGSGDLDLDGGGNQHGNIAAGTPYYLKPGVWTDDNAFFAAVFEDGNGNTVTVRAEICDDEGTYRVEAPSPGSWKSIRWHRVDPSDNGSWNDTSADGANNLLTVNDWNKYTWSTYTGTDKFLEAPVTNADTIYFFDNTTDNSLDDKDAKMFVVINDNNDTKVYEMIETIDYKYGRNLWYAKLDDISTTTDTFKFYRTSVFATTKNLLNGSSDSAEKWWGVWDAGPRDDKILFRANANSTGNWSNTKATKPDSMAHFTYGVWVDTKGNGNTVDAVKWFNKKDKEYHIYLPSYTNLNSVKLYTSFDGAKIKGGYYSSDRTLNKYVANTLKIKEGSSYTFTCDSGEYTLKIYKSASVSTMLMDTNRDLWTATISFNNPSDWPKDKQVTGDEPIANAYKDAIETSGTYAFYDESGLKRNTNGNGDAATLKKIKGRGNSTFNASMQKYGKYAYNFNLEKAQTLIDGATASKKWSLLANNVDHSMMRNTFIYSLADDIGIKYAPETQLVDVYNEGNYLGAYTLTEKVEYGSGTLMDDMENLDDYHKDTFGNGYDDKIQEAESSITVGDKTYKYQYWTGKGDFDFNSPNESFKQKNFLLEFELNERYQNELSWFKSEYTNQCVVVKYPEYVTKQEMEWIVNLYANVEQAVYSGDATLEQLSALIDVDSFAKMYLIQELTLNLDAAATSFYIHNNGEKLVASPVWDYDWSMGSYFFAKPINQPDLKKTNSSTLDDPKQMFARYKVMNTGKGEGDNYNFQAQLAQNSSFWNEVQKIYTNIFVPVLDMYVYNDSVDGKGGYTEKDAILSDYLPKFKASMAMNDARWSGIGSYGTAEGWGTKVTSDYSTFTADMSKKDFQVGKNDSSTSNDSKYVNTVYYLNDWLATRWNYLSSSNKSDGSKDILYLDNERYRLVEDITFGITISGQSVTLTPSIKISKNNEVVDYEDMTLVVYVDGEVYETVPMTNSHNIHLDGGNYDIRLKAYPNEFPQFYRMSDTKNITVTKDGEAAKVKVYFKSSDSYRYTPSVTVGETKIQMTQIGDALCSIDAPLSTAQSYHWYEATVDAVWGKSLELKFTNLLNMNATCTITKVNSLEMYFVVDNLNTGKQAIDVSNLQPYQRNMVKSAVNMYIPDTSVAGTAYTAFNGRTYVLGDTDGKNDLTILDVTLIQLALAKKVDLDETAAILADYNLDGITSIGDATDIQVSLVQ